MASAHGLLNVNDDSSIDDPGFLNHNPNRFEWTEVSQTKKKFASATLICLLVSVPFIILIVLYSRLDTTSVTNNYTTETAVVTGTLTASQSIKFGTPVSLTATGSVQAGGGTSIYKNVLEFTQNCPEYIGIDAVFEDMYLMSYIPPSDSAQLSTTFALISVGPNPNQATLLTRETIPYEVYETVTLNQAEGTFVAITRDYSQSEETAVVVGGTISSFLDSAQYSIAWSYSETYTSIYSVEPQITRLSDTTFAIAYYQYGSQSLLMTRYGSYVDGSVTLSEPVTFASDASNSTYMELVGLSPEIYLLLYYNSGPATNSTGPLTAEVAYVIEKASDTGAPVVSVELKGSPSTLPYSVPALNFYATKITNSTAVVAYVNAQTNYGISCVTVEITKEFEGIRHIGTNYSAEFGPTWDVTTGLTLTETYFGNMDLDIVAVSDAGQFLVLFSDLSNNAIMTAVLGRASPTGLARISPSFELSGIDTDVNKQYFWGALAAGSTVPYASQMAIVTAITDFGCNDNTSIVLNVMEILPPPIGVSTAVRVGGTVAMAGSIPNYKSLVPGQLYFTNTMGDLIAAGGFYGTTPDPAACAAGEAYVEDAASKTIVTLNSQVGLATSGETLLLKLPEY